MPQTYGDRWEIVRPLNEGGQAHTFIVKDLRGGGEVSYVLKRLKNPKRIGRFKQEIEAVRNLSHPNILSLIDFDLSAEKAYMVTNFCAGGTLQHCDPRWYSRPSVAFDLFRAVCEAVAYAHDAGIIHRDLKPDNLFLRSQNGPIVVGDFGICYIETGDERLTETAEAVGPRLFIAPELEDGRLEDNAWQSDVYSLGKILYWLLSGGKIFSREKYRDAKWDLKGIPHEYLDQNIYMEHVTRLLDHMIVADPKARDSLAEIIKSLHRIERLVSLGLNPVSSELPQQCTYCGWGTYRLVAQEGDVYNFGFNGMGSARWRIWVCNECGHVQMFRLDLAKRGTWWEKNKR